MTDLLYINMIKNHSSEELVNLDEVIDKLRARFSGKFHLHFDDYDPYLTMLSVDVDKSDDKDYLRFLFQNDLVGASFFCGMVSRHPNQASSPNLGMFLEVFNEWRVSRRESPFPIPERCKMKTIKIVLEKFPEPKTIPPNLQVLGYRPVKGPDRWSRY